MTEQATTETETVTAMTTPAPLAPVVKAEMDLIDVQTQMEIVKTMMVKLMEKDKHFGVIPGCGKKPTLLKPGAELLGFRFRLYAEYAIERIDMPGWHREYDVTCVLRHIGSDEKVGEGVATCSTMESKYRYRNAERKCPSCGKAAIIKGKAQYGGGWICFKKKDGCGQKYSDDDARIVGQTVGRIENEDLADSWNTVKKIAKKRALVDATLSATAASEYFTQDIEEMFNNNVDVIDIEPVAVAPEPEPVKPVEPVAKPEPEPTPEPPVTQEPPPEPEPTPEPEPQQPAEPASQPAGAPRKAWDYGDSEELPQEMCETICRVYAKVTVGKGVHKGEVVSLSQKELETIVRKPVKEWVGEHAKVLNILLASLKDGADPENAKGLRYGREPFTKAIIAKFAAKQGNG